MEALRRRTFAETKTLCVMETKKSPKASLENKRVLFAEIGLICALLAVLAAFSYSTQDRARPTLMAQTSCADIEEIIPVTTETPPAPPSVSMPSPPPEGMITAEARIL